LLQVDILSENVMALEMLIWFNQNLKERRLNKWV